MPVVLIQSAILLFVLKTNMFLIIRAKHVPQALIMLWGSASGPDTVCDSIICNENYYVSEHECTVS